MNTIHDATTYVYGSNGSLRASNTTYSVCTFIKFVDLPTINAMFYMLKVRGSQSLCVQ